jgi:FkbM family methyltransferase
VNLSGIPKSSLLGRLIRYPLRFIPKDAAVPILQGRFKGKKWIVGSANHGYWLGSYEFKKRLLFERTIPPGSVVYDVGGFVGYYTLLASVLVGQEGRVVVFEPLPRNLYYLKEHLQLNGISNVTVVEAAVSDQVGTLSFKEGPSRARGKLAEDGGLQVQAVRLDDLVESGELPEPQYMKVDVEGAELRAFAGAQRLMEALPPDPFPGYARQRPARRMLPLAGGARLSIWRRSMAKTCPNRKRSLPCTSKGAPIRGARSGNGFALHLFRLAQKIGAYDQQE